MRRMTQSQMTVPFKGPAPGAECGNQYCLKLRVVVDSVRAPAWRCSWSGQEV